MKVGDPGHVGRGLTSNCEDTNANFQAACSWAQGALRKARFSDRR